jgi:hypothetical protein
MAGIASAQADIRSTQMTQTRSLRILAVAAVALFIAACASTKLTTSWRNPQYAGGAMKKMAIFALVKDDGLRRFAEEQMVQNIPAGTTAVPSYRIFDRLEEDHEKVMGRLVKEGFDSVMVMRLVAMDKSQTYVPPQTYVTPMPAPVVVGPYGGVRPYYGSFYGYYGPGYANAYTTAPGYTVDNTTVVVETMLYRVPDDMPVWSATTRTLNPQSKPEMIQAIVDLVEEQLIKQKLVGTAAR